MTNANSILVLDDEEMVRLNLVAFLEDEGFETNEANNAEDALQYLQRHGSDLVIVDMRLPTMDGNQFIEIARRKYPHLKFIIHTGSLEYALPPHLKELGLADSMVMYKPVLDMAAMVVRIRNQLSNIQAI